ncbi:MAG: rRNA maturation RNase YbeY [Myxococcota bacterium]
MKVWLRSRGLQRRSVRHPELIWRAKAMLGELGLEDAELSVLLCDDATIRTLNRRYRKRNSATDVLAFSMREGPGPATEAGLLGDVVISLATARRQAAERDRPIVEEVTWLLAHGLLHLVGYDHQTDADEAEMNEKTRALLEAVERERAR